MRIVGLSILSLVSVFATVACGSAGSNEVTGSDSEELTTLTAASGSTADARFDALLRANGGACYTESGRRTCLVDKRVSPRRAVQTGDDVGSVDDLVACVSTASGLSSCSPIPPTSGVVACSHGTCGCWGIASCTTFSMKPCPGSFSCEPVGGGEIKCYCRP